MNDQRTNERGMTLLETTVASLLTVTVLMGVAALAQQNEKSFSAENSRLEIQRKGRLVLQLVSQYLRSAGSDRADAFSEPPYTTSSSLPIARASASSIRIRSDYNDDGTASGTVPEDVTVSWNSGAKTLTVGSTTFDGISDFVLRFYNSAGAELTPPAGGWNITIDAGHGTTLRSIARIRLEIEVEARHIDLTTRERQRMAIVSEAVLPNQLVL